jgi:hypothetical protein
MMTPEQIEAFNKDIATLLSGRCICESPFVENTYGDLSAGLVAGHSPLPPVETKHAQSFICIRGHQLTYDIEGGRITNLLLVDRNDALETHVIE